MPKHILLLALSLGCAGAYAASPSSLPAVRLVLWNPPQSLTRSQWIWGPAGPAAAPRPPFRFLKENLGGTNPKIDVIDARGAHWIVKFGGEVHAETFMSRLLAAAGYPTEPIYFVPEGVIKGAHGLKRARPFVSRTGAFRSARFKLRDPAALDYADQFQWSWNDNPFLGSRQLNGLKILIMLASNWDAKDSRDGEGSNTAVFVAPHSEPRTYLYAFTDWGSTLGKWGGFFKRDRWDVSGYERQTRNFVKAVRGDTIIWGYQGKHRRDVAGGVTVEDVRWLLPYLSGISEGDLRAGFAASGADGPAADRFAKALHQRIARLEAVAGESRP